MISIRLPATKSLPQFLRALAVRYRAAKTLADREHEMSLNRFVLSFLVFGYLHVQAAQGDLPARNMLMGTTWLFVLYWCTALSLFVHMLALPERKWGRRVIGMMVDFWPFSYGLYYGGETAAPLYLIYLWVILGNGFRFGVPYLLAATVVGASGFAAVLWASSFWSAHSGLGYGLLAGLIVVPLYTSTLIRKLSSAKRLAEEANRSKSLFLASVSHEFRTPLNAIIGMGDFLARTKLGADQRDMLQTVRKSAQVLLDLVDNILDYARADAGKMPRQTARFDLHELVVDTQRILSAQASAKGLQVNIHVCGNVPPLVIGGRRHIQEILLNLGGNGVKFTQKGSVTIFVREIGGDAERVRLRFEVRDTGIGIEAGAREHIFERFTQANDSIINRFGGTGLGLAICKQMVELYGGTIGVETVLGAGSTFWFELDFDLEPAPEDVSAPQSRATLLLLTRDPAIARAVERAAGEIGAALVACDSMEEAGALRRDNSGAVVLLDEAFLTVDAEERAPQAGDLGSPRIAIAQDSEHASRCPSVCSSIRPDADAAELARAVRLALLTRAAVPDEAAEDDAIAPGAGAVTILIADDNKTNQSITSRILASRGYSYEIAQNGAQALTMMLSGRYDLVLMDVNMPVMSGLEATRQYRASSSGRRHMPIVAFTADVTDETRAACQAAGMDACLVKPVRPARLLEVVSQLVEVQGAAHGVADPASQDDRPREHASGGRSRPVFDPSKLQALEKLGGGEFVEEVTQTFLLDTQDTVEALNLAVLSRDVEEFRDAAHALRSAAANVGAERIFDLCLGWRSIELDDIVDRGEIHLARLGEELEAARRALDYPVSAARAGSGAR